MSNKKEQINEPEFCLSPLNNQMINYKIYFMSAKEKILYFLIFFILGGIASYIFYGGLFKEDGDPTLMTYISNSVFFVAVGLIAAKIGMPVMRKSLKEKRDKKLRKQFIDLLETVATSLSSGSTVNDAFINAQNDLCNQYTDSDLIIVELKEISVGLSNGKTLEEMLFSFGTRSDNKDIENFSNVISNCYRLGGNFRDVVRRTRDVISEKIQIEEEIATKISSNKLQLNVMSLMPILLVGMLKMTSDSFAANLTNLVGVVVTTIAVVLFVIAYLWGQKIIKIQ